MAEIKNIINKVREYLSFPSVTCYEKKFMDKVQKDINHIGFKCENYKDKLLFVDNNYYEDKFILLAHLDRNGLIYHDDICEYSTNYFIDKKKLTKRKVKNEKIVKRCLNEKFIFYNKNGDNIEYKVIKIDKNGKMTLDKEIHNSSTSEIPLAYKNNFKGNDNIISGQLDNVINIAIIYQLLSDGFEGLIILSTKEEIGKGYEDILGFLESQKIKSKIIINLDTTSFDEKDCPIGKIILREEDSNIKNKYTFNLDLNKIIEEKIGRDKIIYKDKIFERKGKKKIGKIELGHIVKESKGDFNGIPIQIPSFNYHTNSETINMIDLNIYYESLKKILL